MNRRGFNRLGIIIIASRSFKIIRNLITSTTWRRQSQRSDKLGCRIPILLSTAVYSSSWSCSNQKQACSVSKRTLSCLAEKGRSNPIWLSKLLNGLFLVPSFKLLQHPDTELLLLSHSFGQQVCSASNLHNQLLSSNNNSSPSNRNKLPDPYNLFNELHEQ